MKKRGRNPLKKEHKTMNGEVDFTVEHFIYDFPEFATIPSHTLDLFLLRTKAYISTENYGVIQGDARLLACELMMAHLLTIHNRIVNDNQTQAVSVSSASIQNVSVSLAPPANRTQFEFWLNLTVYGTELWSLLTTKTPCGIYVQGTPQRVLF